MREILFRGKGANNGEWMEGSLVKVTINGLAFHLIFADDFEFNGISAKAKQHCCIDPSTIGQYTGLTDKNGKKIFEGDIFEFPDEVWESYYTDCGTEYNSWESKNRGVVGFCEDYGSFDFVQYLHNENSVDADLHENGSLQFADFVRDLEVIGNIHDNPELLEGRQWLT